MMDGWKCSCGSSKWKRKWLKTAASISPPSSQQLIMISPQARHLNLFMFKFKTLVMASFRRMLICTQLCESETCMVSKPATDEYREREREGSWIKDKSSRLSPSSTAWCLNPTPARQISLELACYFPEPQTLTPPPAQTHSLCPGITAATVEPPRR